MAAPAWLDELDLHAGPPDAAMGTRSLDMDRWLLVDDGWTAQRDEARRLLCDRRAEVLAPSTTDGPARELGLLIDDWLREHHPDLVDHGHADEPDPLASARSGVAEDLCLLTPSDAGWLLDAGAVCFPSYWRLRDKVGHPLFAVHESVPGYAGPLAGRVDGFLSRLRPGQGVWRRNWSIHDVPDLFLPEHGDHATTPAPAGRWLRSEYQTLVRLVANDAVVFTIRTQQVPIEAIAARPDTCAAIADAVQLWSPAQRAYKGGAADDALVRWLRQTSEG